MSFVVELRDISKNYIRRSWCNFWRCGSTAAPVRALDRVNLSLRSREIFGLLGPNGAGKTTLLKILASLVLPDQGRATICGFDVEKQAEQVKKHIGVVNTSERSFYWRLSGEQNLNFFAALYGMPSAARKKRVQEVLSLVGLAEKGGEPFMQYSTGQQQRLAIGRALLGDPLVLLMDEPTRSLDPLGAEEIRTFARQELRDRLGRTILWNTHNLREAEQLCDRVAVLHRGRILVLGSMSEIQALFDHHRVYRLTIGAHSAETLRRCDLTPLRIHPVADRWEVDIRGEERDIPDILRNLIAEDVQIYGCRKQAVELEKVFAQLLEGLPIGEQRQEVPAPVISPLSVPLG